MKLSKAIYTIALIVLLVVPIAARQNQTPNQPNGSGSSSPAPMLVIDSFTHDFGEVKSGTPLRYIFKVKNQGKADLLINNVSPG
jgi:hypothetical protein